MIVTLYDDSSDDKDDNDDSSNDKNGNDDKDTLSHHQRLVLMCPRRPMIR